MEEFIIAHRKVVEEQKNFLIPILLEDLDSTELGKHPELQTYIRTYAYIDARQLQHENVLNIDKKIEHLRKRIR